MEPLLFVVIVGLVAGSAGWLGRRLPADFQNIFWPVGFALLFFAEPYFNTGVVVDLPAIVVFLAVSFVGFWLSGYVFPKLGVA